MPAVEAPGPRSEALPQGGTTPSAEADAALLEGVPGIDHPLDVSELSQAAAAIAAAQHEQEEQGALDAILADLNDVDADVGRVHVHAPKHMLIDDSPDAAKARSDLVAYLFHKLHQPMGALVDVSVTQFAVARARKHNQQDSTPS